MKRIVEKRALAYLFCAGFVGMQLLGCRSVLCSDEETLRLTSPDSVLDAVLVEKDCGATTSTAYDLYIVPKGGKYEQGHESFVGDHMSGVRAKNIMEAVQVPGHSI